MARSGGNGRPGRGYFGTEAQARKVKEQIESTRRGGRKVQPGTRGIDPTKPTAKSPKGVMSYEEARKQGEAERRAKERKARQELERKRQQRLQQSKKKVSKRKVAKKKATTVAAARRKKKGGRKKRAIRRLV